MSESDCCRFVSLDSDFWTRLTLFSFFSNGSLYPKSVHTHLFIRSPLFASPSFFLSFFLCCLHIFYPSHSSTAFIVPETPTFLHCSLRNCHLISSHLIAIFLNILGSIETFSSFAPTALLFPQILSPFLPFNWLELFVLLLLIPNAFSFSILRVFFIIPSPLLLLPVSHHFSPHCFLSSLVGKVKDPHLMHRLWASATGNNYHNFSAIFTHDDSKVISAAIVDWLKFENWDLAS